MDLATRTDDTSSPYGYTPTLWICVLFVALFSITTIVHAIQALVIKPQSYWLLPTLAICGLMEILGWSGRLWSSQNPSLTDPFLLQITTTITAPTFLTAALFTIFGKVISALGLQYSRLSPKAYLITFLGADFLALGVQSVGGAKASIAYTHGNDATPGGHIMLAGIFLQMVGITLYLVLMTEFFLRFNLRKPLRQPPSSGFQSHSPTPSESTFVDSTHMEKLHTPRRAEVKLAGETVMSQEMKLMVVGLVATTLLILIRTIYRTAELLDGWRGPIITNETYFNVFDGAPVVFCMLILNVLHPGILLRGR